MPWCRSGRRVPFIVASAISGITGSKIVIALQLNAVANSGLQQLTSMLVNKRVDHALSAERTATQGG